MALAQYVKMVTILKMENVYQLNLLHHLLNLDNKNKKICRLMILGTLITWMEITKENIYQQTQLKMTNLKTKQLIIREV